jgi:glycosyltransferase involved in cell wall biosynthesis
MKKLAIVIPYFKRHFFKETLLSIKNQTNKDFHLYIGDDNSPFDPTGLISECFGDSNAVTYIKFDNNLGSIHLTRQWERCIDTATETYIWLFSDDDVMPADAVERFYKFIENYPDAELVRFNMNIINDKHQVITFGPPHPPHETSHDFIIRRLQGQCISSACEYIFTKDIYLRKDKFVNFPVGWAADDATWLKFGTDTGIYTIPGTPVLWRFGATNISSSTKNQTDKTKACLMFVKFVREKTNISKRLQLHWLYLQTNVLKYSTIMKIRFFGNLIYSGMFGLSDIFEFATYGIIKKGKKLLNR